jgi:succinoglycan biosynthesis protein ExoM
MKTVVCICTYKRSELLERLLLSLQHMHLGELDPKDFRALVVDNYPDDGRARAVCERVCGQVPMPLDLVEETRRGTSFARNRAVDEALRQDADFIAFIDDDDLPEPDWLLRLIEKQQETRADIVFGTEHRVMNAGWPAWLKKSPLFEKRIKEGVTEYGTPRGISTYNVLVGRGILERVKSTGPVFSPEFAHFKCEDTDFFIRAARSGATFARADKSVINRNYEPHRVTVCGLLREARRLGTYNMVLLKRYGAADQAGRRRKKAVAKIASNLLKLPFCTFSRVALMRDLFYLARELATLRAYYARTSLKSQDVTQ